MQTCPQQRSWFRPSPVTLMFTNTALFEWLKSDPHILIQGCAAQYPIIIRDCDFYNLSYALTVCGFMNTVYTTLAERTRGAGGSSSTAKLIHLTPSQSAWGRQAVHKASMMMRFLLGREWSFCSKISGNVVGNVFTYSDQMDHINQRVKRGETLPSAIIFLNMCFAREIS